MHDQSFQAARERIAPNVYRRRRKNGETVFEIVFRDTDGRQRRRRLDARTEREALREARALLTQRDTGDRVVAAQVTVAEFVDDDFLPTIEALAQAGRRSVQGVDLDRSTLRVHVLPALGRHRLGELEPGPIAALLRSMRKSGLSESRCHHVTTVLRSVYRLAKSRRLVTRCPVDELDPAEMPKRRAATTRQRLDVRQVADLVRHAPEQYRAGVAILAYTGMRLSEALALRWSDVDLVEGEIRVGGQLTRGTRARAAAHTQRKSGGAPYAVLILPALEHELTRRLETELAAGRGRDSDYVLAMPRTGRPPAQRNLTGAVSKAAAAAGVGYATSQDLRRSFASIAARLIHDPAEAAHMTGHSLDTWVRHYVGRFGASRRDEARARLLESGLGAVE
jgi:integrase